MSKQDIADYIDAVMYFNSFEEGDNITVTSDFVDYAEILIKLLIEKNQARP